MMKANIQGPLTCSSSKTLLAAGASALEHMICSGASPLLFGAEASQRDLCGVCKHPSKL
jgi:hypothetical protein